MQTKPKDCVSLVFYTNADGSDKRALTVNQYLGKLAKSRYFKIFNPALYVDYKSDKKPWLTAALF